MQTSLMGFLCMVAVAAVGAVLGFKMSKNNAEVSAVKGAFVALCGCIVLFYVVVVGFSQRGLSLFFAVGTFILPLLVFYALVRRDSSIDGRYLVAKLYHDIRKGKPISDALVRQHTLSFKTEEKPNQGEPHKEAPVCMVDEVLEVVQLDIEQTSEESTEEELKETLLTEGISETEETLLVEEASEIKESLLVEDASEFEESLLAEDVSETEDEKEPYAETDYSEVIEQDDFELEEARDLLDKPVKVQASDEFALYEILSFEDDEADLEEPVLSQRIAVSAEEDFETDDIEDIEDIDDIEEPIFVQEESQVKSDLAVRASVSEDAEAEPSGSESSEAEEIGEVADLFDDSESGDAPVEVSDSHKDTSSSGEPEACEPEEPTVSNSPTSFNPQSYFDRATALRDNGQYVVAALLYRECLEKAVDYKIVNKAALEEIACYVKAGKVQKAAELAEVFLKTARKLTPAEKIKAEAVLRAGMHHE